VEDIVNAAAQVDSATAPPPWLSAWVAAVYPPLAAHPLALAALVVVGGVVLGVVARSLILYSGLKVTSRTSTPLDDQVLRMGAAVVARVIIYLSLAAAIETLPLPAPAVRIAVRVLLSVLVVQLMRAGLKAIPIGLEVLSRVGDRFSIVEERTVPLFDLVFTILIVGIAGYALLQVWSIDPTAWLASAGVVGIAVGFAARDTLANLFAGFFIIADAPYRVGDYVVLDSGERGEVTRVGVRSTRLLTRDDVEIIIPNSVMAGTKIINESGGRWVKSRLRLAVGVAYGSDVDRVVEVLEGVARGHPDMVQDPEPRARMRGFGESSLDFELHCWVSHPSEREHITHELFMAIYKALAAARIEIPFPQRDVWVRRIPEAAGAGEDQAGA
jgi:MscS family membrane protein